MVVVDEEAVKAQKSLRNLNLLLYMASFLLVAAGAAFIAANFSQTTKLVGVWAIIAVFYGAGLVLYSNSERLRPAAVAFLGTGLALIPFAGFAVYTYTDFGWVGSWTLTSIIGLIGYFYAALRLQSQLVSYLTMAFILSLAASMGATASSAIVWQFVLLIVVSLIASCIAMINSSWVPAIFKEPIERTGQIITPVVLLGSLVLFRQMSLSEYQIVFAVATLHYFVAWLQRHDVYFESAVRALLHVTLLLGAWSLTDGDIVAFGVVFLILATVQQAYSITLVTKNARRMQLEQFWICTLLVVQASSLLTWIGSAGASSLSSLTIGIVAITACIAALRLRDARYGYVTLAGLIVLSYIIPRMVFDPPAAWSFVVGWLMALAFGSLSLYRWSLTRRVQSFQLCVTAIISFFGLSIITSIANFSYDWPAALLCAAAAAFIMTASYVVRSRILEPLSIVFIIPGLFFIGDTLQINSDWIVIFVSLVSAAVSYAALAYHMLNKSYTRVRNMLAASQISLLLLVFTTSVSVAPEWISYIVLMSVSLVFAGLCWTKRSYILDSPTGIVRPVLLVSYPLTFAAALIVSFGLHDLATIFALLVGSVLAWVASYSESRAELMIAGNVLFTWLVVQLWVFIGLDSVWMAMAVSWIVAAVLYAGYWIFVDYEDKDRQNIFLVSTWIALIIAIVTQVPETRLAADITMMVFAATISNEGIRRKNMQMIEIAVYVLTLGLQRAVNVALPDLNVLFYAHWWAIAIALTAFSRPNTRQLRMIISMGIISVFSGWYALTEGGLYSLVFLIEHIILLVVGVLKQKTWAIWWGIIAASLAVLYFLRDIAFLAFGFLGLLLIAIVVWRLMRHTTKQ